MEEGYGDSVEGADGNDDDISRWALTLGKLGIWNAIHDGAITPTQFNAVMCHPIGLRVAGEELHRTVEFEVDSPSATAPE